jgi:BirA family biotin operon repressor/biotin-[acetyl-CoA-carboxylase] ligase
MERMAVLKRKLIEILADGRFHSGSEVGDLLSVSRAAVWKQVKRLEEYGLVIHAVPGKGYQIPAGLDLLDRDRIIQQLEPQLLATLQSFNIADASESLVEPVAEQLRHQGHAGFYVCLAESKILSRAKYGRASYSTYAAYASLAIGARLRADHVVLDGLQPAAAVAVREALATNACLIKWPNELMASGKSLGHVQVDVRAMQPGYVDVLIDVDVRIKSVSFLSNNPLNPIISLEGLLRMPVDRNQTIGNILNALAALLVSCQSGGVQSYLKRWQACDLLSDRQISLTSEGRQVDGCARGLDAHGYLRVETQQGMELFETGDVELKL